MHPVEVYFLARYSLCSVFFFVLRRAVNGVPVARAGPYTVWAQVVDLPTIYRRSHLGHDLDWLERAESVCHLQWRPA